MEKEKRLDNVQELAMKIFECIEENAKPISDAILAFGYLTSFILNTSQDKNLDKARQILDIHKSAVLNSLSQAGWE